jgi:hypothetical protein
MITSRATPHIQIKRPNLTWDSDQSYRKGANRRSFREEAMTFPGVPGAVGEPFDRKGDMIVNQVDPNIFTDDPDATRVVVVVVYNHLLNDLFFINDSVDAGGFTPGFGPPDKIAGKSAFAYRLQSFDGAAVNVTVSYGLAPDDPTGDALSVTVSAPDGGGFTERSGSNNGFPTDIAASPGDHRQVDVDLNN